MTRFESLLNGYKNDTLTNEELNELLLLFDANDAALENSIGNDLQQNAFMGMTTASQRQRLFDNILERTGQKQKSRMVALWLRASVAAAILLLVGVGTYLWLSRKPENKVAKTDKVINVPQDVMPGGNKAVLTLADGSTIMLDSAANGKLTKQGKTTVIKPGDGQLVYTRENEKPGNTFTIDHSPVTYNTLATPRGGQYELVLPDGSKVWLNAASSIRYPTAFKDKERQVEIQGEAYFEVAHDKTKPFKVSFSSGSGQQDQVEVLGTHFNVNTYKDEAMVRATLLEGIVKVTGGAAFAMLKPGEQAVLSNNSQLTIDHSPNLNQVMSWKNGQFYFSNADIESIMRQMARWYDVEVEYKAHPQDSYTVSLSRNVPVSKLLKYLELSGGVKFKIEGKKVIVM